MCFDNAILVEFQDEDERKRGFSVTSVAGVAELFLYQSMTVL